MIGFTPQQVNEMTVWQFMAAVDGYVEANTPDDGSLTTQEIDELWDWVQGGFFPLRKSTHC
ncbi:hypothetical protein D3C87_1756780 [compost metagenome]